LTPSAETVDAPPTAVDTNAAAATNAPKIPRCLIATPSLGNTVMMSATRAYAQAPGQPWLVAL
jgi:hypothetical protein